MRFAASRPVPGASLPPPCRRTPEGRLPDPTSPRSPRPTSFPRSVTTRTPPPLKKSPGRPELSRAAAGGRAGHRTDLRGASQNHEGDTASGPAPLSIPPPEAAGGAPGRRARSKATAQASRQSLTPETWIDAATEVLVERGIDHVRVDVLATQLGVTRGSFYWHFRDREDLLRRVLEAWRHRATTELTRRLTAAGQDARDQLRDVISLPHRGRAAARAARIELAIRAWARRDAMARAALDEADASRIDYHRLIFESLGFEHQEARLRAFVLYSCEVAESLLHRQGPKTDQLARQRFLEVLMQTPVKPA